MFPFTNRMKTIPWTDIKSIRVVDYDPIGAYGGWGFRGTSKNRALNIYGNIGIKMQLSNGNELLIGTNQRELAEQTIAKLFIQ